MFVSSSCYCISSTTVCGYKVIISKQIQGKRSHPLSGADPGFLVGGGANLQRGF